MDRVNRPTSRLVLAGVVAALALSLLSGTAFAAKPGGGHGGGHHGGTAGTSGLAVVMVNDLNGNGAANWGDTVTFTFVTTASEPNVSVTCSQNGIVVYGAVAGFYAGYPWPWTVNMTLSSTAWADGAANCTAVLYYFSGTSQVNLGSLSFTAGA